MSYWLVVILLVIISILLYSYYKKRRIIKLSLGQLRADWGKPKNESRNFKFIAIYSNANSNKIASSLIEDLDLEHVFDYIDRTNSKPGQQYLYKKLHEPETSANKLTELDRKIEALGKNKDLQERIQLELTKLNAANAYYLPELFLKEQVPLFSPLLSSFIQISGILVITLAVLLTLIHSQVYFLALIGLAMTNLVVHYKSKGKISQYTHSLPQLIILSNVAKWVLKNLGDQQDENIKNSLDKARKLKRTLWFVNFENGIASDNTDILYSIFELIKTFLLLEPLMFIYSLKNVNKYRGDIEVIYKYVGEIDMLIAVDSIRAGLPYFCKPDFLVNDSQINVEGLYHPLVTDCVPNSMVSNADQGVLVTGSNMSGKTTFIRAMAINALFSQTLYTCCSTLYHAPLLKIQTSIRVSDDVEEHKSYFQAEALSVLNIIKQCESNKPLKTLVIIDEIFRGTNTIERVAAAKSVLSYLTAGHNFVFVSTHDLELAELLGDDYAVYSFEELIADKRLVFDYKIKQGLLKNKNGIAILETLGYPQSLVKDAYKVSEQLRARYLL